LIGEEHSEEEEVLSLSRDFDGDVGAERFNTWFPEDEDVVVELTRASCNAAEEVLVLTKGRGSEDVDSDAGPGRVKTLLEVVGRSVFG
jgi:hypothetical protein